MMPCIDNGAALSAGGRPESGSVVMLYRGNGSVQIRGPVTGRIYRFPRQHPFQPVDAHDVPSLVRTRLFTPVR